MRRGLTLAMTSALLALGLGTSPALADTKKTDPVSTTKEVSMKYEGFDKKIAKENGYDIRKDDRGVEYSIPETTPEGDLTGAKYIPGQEPSAASNDGITTFNTTFGNCGTATLTGSGRGFFTAYAITDPWVGPAYYHEWRVAVASQFGYQVWNLDGVPPGYSWYTSRSIPFGGWYNGYVSHGKVFTTLGFVCTALNPSDAWAS